MLEEIAKESKKKIFIFVDELDRCRPTFAIETLERIKHFFDVDGIHFVLMLDKEQLSHSVKALYGSKCDTTGYLMRFIDVEYRIPDPDGSKYLRTKIGPANEFHIYIDKLAPYFKLSLREYDKLVTWIKAFLSTPNTRIYNVSQDLMYYYSYIILLKLKEPEVFNILSSGEDLLNLILSDMPHINSIDKYVKENAGVEVVTMTHALVRRHYNYGFSFSGSMSVRENEWKDNTQLSDVIINGFQEMNFLDSLDN